MIKSLYPTFQRWSEKGSVWIISDTHFDDPDCKLMNKNWPTPSVHIALLRQYIHKNDTVIHLGDVGDPKYMDDLQGYKVLIMGNHDSSASKLREHFDEVYTGPLFIGDKILLSHEPIYGIDWCMNLHGHDHTPLNIGDKRHKNFAANVVGYLPISLGALIKEGLLSDVTDIHRKTINEAIKKKTDVDLLDMSWFHDDITWCASRCDNTRCYRNPVNMRNKNGVHSFADFYASGECPIGEELYREINDEDDRK